MICPSCQQSNQQTARVCKKCRAPLQSACSSCGTRVSIGHKFCSNCGAPIRSATFSDAADLSLVAPATGIRRRGQVLEGERKNVTVLFADILGSTAQIQHLDPEAARDYLDDGVKIMTDAVHEYGGTVFSIEGDGIQALFGAPKADEDHAMLACYAALEIQRRANALPNWRFGFRVGINSGEVVVSLGHADFSAGYRATGVAVHLASRLQNLCKPGSIVISAATHRLASGLIEVCPLGRMPIRGMDTDVECYELLSRISPRTSWQRRGPLGMSPFVGRTQEREFARSLAKKAAAGQGQILALIGDPGTGKSRLVFEIANSCRATGWTVVETGAPHFGTGTTLLPISQLLRHVFEIDDRDPASDAADKVENALRRLNIELSHNLPPLLSLLGLSPADPTWQSIEPQERRRWVVDSFVHFMLSFARVEPALIIFEDLQWADDETLALLDRLALELKDGRIFMLITARPEFPRRWTDCPHYHKLSVKPLNKRNTVELTARLLGDDESVRSLQQVLSQWTGGTPLFVEEMVRSLNDEGVLNGETGSFHLTKPQSDLRAPSTLQTVIASRIDRLRSDEKGILQTSAVIGEHIQVSLIQDLTGHSMRKTEQLLNSLVAMGFLQRSRWFGGFGMRFRHSIIHDVTYNTILKERRRELHARALHAIERTYPDRLNEYVEELARQATLGEQWAKASTYYVRAAEAAVDRSAYVQSIEFYKQGLSALCHLPDDNAVLQLRLDAELGQRRAYGAIGASKEAFENLDRCEQLARTLNDNRRLTEICTLKAVELCHQGAIDRAIVAGREACSVAEPTHDMSLGSNATVSLGFAYYHHGSFAAAAEALRKVADTIGHDAPHARSGASSTVSVRCLGLLVGSLTFLGDFEAALEYGAQAIEAAEKTNRSIDLGTACYFAGLAHLHKGDFEKAIRVLRRGNAACIKGNVRYMLPWLGCELGYARFLLRHSVSAKELIKESLQQCIAMNLLHGLGRAVIRYAHVCLLLGELAEAHDRAMEALAISRKYHYRAIEVWALQLLGEAKMRRGNLQSGARDLSDALKQATDLGMRPDAAHLRVALAPAFRSARHGTTARQQLLEALGTFATLGMQRYTSRVRKLADRLQIAS
jgi:predicted ATPase/class 3 adenylate cyclase